MLQSLPKHYFISEICHIGVEIHPFQQNLSNSLMAFPGDYEEWCLTIFIHSVEVNISPPRQNPHHSFMFLEGGLGEGCSTIITNSIRVDIIPF